MDQIGSILGSIGSAAGSAGGSILSAVKANPLKALAGTLAGVGTLSNYNQQQQQDSLRNKILGQTPASVASGISALEQPLNAGLVSNVENQAQGYLGERGLNESPAITAEVVSQALAPYYQQSQQLASNQYNNMIGSQEYGGLWPTPNNTAGLWQTLFTPGATGANPKNTGTPPSTATSTTWPTQTPGIVDPGWLNTVLGGIG